MRDESEANQEDDNSEANSSGEKRCDFWLKLGGEYVDHLAVQDGFLTAEGVVTARGKEEIKAIRAQDQRKLEERIEKLDQKIQEGRLARTTLKAGALKINHRKADPTQGPKSMIQAFLGKHPEVMLDEKSFYCSDGEVTFSIFFPNGRNRKGNSQKVSKKRFSGKLDDSISELNEFLKEKGL